MKKLFTLAFLFLVFIGFSLKRNVPATYSTIQSALNACNIGDTVLVQPGNYIENIYWPKIKNIKLFSAGDSSNTFIDANFVGRCFTIIDSTYTLIDANTVISGFRLVNGYSDTTTFNGVGIYSYGTKLIIEKCAITNCNVNAVNSNTASILSGGVVYFGVKEATLRNCSLYGNSVYNSSGKINGGIIFMGSSSVSVLYKINVLNNQVSIMSQGTNMISGALIFSVGLFADQMKILNNNVNYLGSSGPNSFNAFLYGAGSTANLSNCLIANNTFSANISVNMSSLVILAPATVGPGSGNLTHLTIVDNRAVSTGSISAISYYGVYWTSTSMSMNHTLTHCIFWNPYNNSSNEVYYAGSSNKFTMSFCDVRKYSSLISPINCYSVTPQFVSSFDYHLKLTSPCINVGTISTTLPWDLDGNPRPLPALSFLDIGCYEMNQTVSTLTPSYSIATITPCQFQPLYLYDVTPKTKNRIWSITPSNVGWPIYNDTVSVPMNFVGNYTISLTVTDSLNAMGTASFVINVLPSPAITLLQSANWLCIGQSAYLTSSSTGTYSSVLWSTGATTQSIVVSPTVLTTYSVTYANNYGCSSSKAVSVGYVNAPAPTITISASSIALCGGQTVTLTANYTSTTTLWPQWSIGGFAQTYILTPTISTVYSATLSEVNGCLGVSNSLSVTVNNCTDIKGNIIANSEIIISPNPNYGEFILNSTVKENSSYEIYNCIGQIIKSGIIEEEKTKINLENYSSGIYFIKIFENKKLLSIQKIILNN